MSKTSMDDPDLTEKHQLVHKITPVAIEGSGADIAASLQIENLQLKRDLASTQAQLRRLKQELLHNDKLAILGTAGAGVAHELNNPLTVISAEADEIIDTIGQEQFSPEQTRTSALNIKKCAERMRVLIDYIRQRVRRDDPMPWARLDVAKIMAESLLIMKPRLNRLGIDIAVMLPDDLPGIWGQKAKLESVFENLISNAADAFESLHDDRRRKIEIRSEELNNGYINIVFADNACGVPTALQKKIFDPFFTSKKSGHGTGLGLAIVSELIDEHGGQVFLDSQEGTGSKFTLRLPVERRISDRRMI